MQFSFLNLNFHHYGFKNKKLENLICIMSGYLRHKNMSIFILDPQGEFSFEFSSNVKLKQIIVK
ncbi:hypothetical protein LCGC14_1403610 [marine sediment metagenome]|uniref:Uncharacterized protein n=1 Tax=marine sediment metagenome TaxID=412755 RepID=A0A0F9JWC3_9ZZZZ